jgi:uncharacterized protein (DUF934 family)
VKVIKNREIVEDSWRLVEDGEPLPAEGFAIVSVERWNSERDALAACDGPVGVVLRSSENPAAIEGRELAPLIAIDFPSFTDGRGYSFARRLRQEFGYEGELRAIGDVLRDQLFFMQRCGIDSFALKAGKNFESSLEAFYDISVTYQGAADDPLPLFRRTQR